MPIAMTSPSDEATGPRPVAAAPSSSKCPVHNQQQHDDAGHHAVSSPSLWSRLFAPGLSSQQQPDTKNPSLSTSENACPSLARVPGNSRRMCTSSLEEAAQHAQTPQPDQRLPLGNARQVSSIPRGTNDSGAAPAPHHQHDNSVANWVYPSEQQLYNAMRAKGWNNVPVDSIPVVLQIHNHINERTWRQIQDWEGRHDLVLTRFQGRPRDLTPKAWLLSTLGYCAPPFDRHDWYVQRPSTTETRTRPQRYVIDYYYQSDHGAGDDNNNLPPSVPYVDARPAWDNPRALWLHASMLAALALPGIASYYRRYMLEWHDSRHDSDEQQHSTDKS